MTHLWRVASLSKPIIVIVTFSESRLSQLSYFAQHLSFRVYIFSHYLHLTPLKCGQYYVILKKILKGRKLCFSSVDISTIVSLWWVARWKSHFFNISLCYCTVLTHKMYVHCIHVCKLFQNNFYIFQLILLQYTIHYSMLSLLETFIFYF